MGGDIFGGIVRKDFVTDACISVCNQKYSPNILGRIVDVVLRSRNHATLK